MLNRMRRAEKAARDAIVREAAYQGRSSFQPPKGVSNGSTTFVNSFIPTETTAGPDGQTQWSWTSYLDGTDNNNAIIPMGFPTKDYQN